MARPTAAGNSGAKNERPPDFSDARGIDPIHRFSNLENMFGDKSASNGENVRFPDRDPVADNDPDVDDDPVDHDDNAIDDDDNDHGTYSFDYSDRTPNQAAKEALRRSRRTEEAVDTLSTKLDSLLSMMQNGRTTAADPSIDASSFSPEDRELINEAMKTDPATALEIMQKQMIRNTQKYAETTVSSRMAKDTAKRNAERDLIQMFPQMKDTKHPFRRAVSDRIREMQSEYRQRGIDPENIPELVKYAAQEVAMGDPRLLGSDDPNTNMRENSRRRNADRVTSMSRTRSGSRKDDLPAITAEDMKRGSRMGLDMSDPNVQKSLQMRRKHYQGRRR